MALSVSSGNFAWRYSIITDLDQTRIPYECAVRNFGLLTRGQPPAKQSFRQRKPPFANATRLAHTVLDAREDAGRTFKGIDPGMSSA